MAGSVSKHSWYEDAIAYLTGTLLVSLGIASYSQAQILSGGTAGLALLGQYASGYSFGLIFFLLNLPFYALSLWRLGWGFTLRTFLAVALVSVLSRLTPQWIGLANINPIYAAVIGGVIIGVGLLVLFRHRAGLGGFNILAVYCQERFGLRAGLVLLAVDLMVMAGALFVVDPEHVALSILGAFVISVTLTINHRPGRYAGMS